MKPEELIKQLEKKKDEYLFQQQQLQQNYAVLEGMKRQVDEVIKMLKGEKTKNKSSE